MQYLRTILLLAFISISCFCYSQKPDSTKSPTYFAGSIAVTNNGISLIPTFSLGDPAGIILLSIGKKKFSFEPEMRFALEGKPWSFLFWFRYRPIQNEKFLVSVGVHPALLFRTEILPINGDSTETLVSRRYIAGDFSPRYLIGKNTSIGVYYLYSHGIDPGAIKNTHFITLNSSFSNIEFAPKFLLRVTPQVYYLNQDGLDGIYATATLTIGRRNFPLSFQTIMNKAIDTEIVSKHFVWNVSLIYGFSKKII